MPALVSWITRRTHPDGAEACIRDTNINVWGPIERRRSGLDDDRILDSIQGLTAADLEAAGPRPRLRGTPWPSGSGLDRFFLVWLHTKRSSNGLGEPIQHIRAQRARAFQEVAQDEDIDADLGGDFLQGLPAVVNSAAQVSGQRVLRRGLVKPAATFEQFRQLACDLLAIAPQLLQQFCGDFLCCGHDSPWHFTGIGIKETLRTL